MISFKSWADYYASEQDAYLDSENGADENIRTKVLGFTVAGDTRIGAYAVYSVDSELVGIYTTGLMAADDQIEALRDELKALLPAGAMLKEMRKAAGLTQTQLASAAGINIRQIQKLEAGEIRLGNLTLANAAKLADALGISMEALLAEGEQ